MKTKATLLSHLRSIIRWTTGTTVTAALIAGCCTLFPALAGSIAALVLTCTFAVVIGLGIALPPINEEDDWVPVEAVSHAIERLRSKIAHARTVRRNRHIAPEVHWSSHVHHKITRNTLTHTIGHG